MTLKCGFEVTQGHWKWCHSNSWVLYGFLFAFHSNYAVSLAISEIFSVKEWSVLESGGRGRSTSWKWCRSIDHIGPTTFCWSAIVTIALSCTIFELFTSDNVGGICFRPRARVRLSVCRIVSRPIALYCTIFELFDVRIIVTLKYGFTGHWRSFKVVYHSKAWVQFPIRPPW